MSLSLLIGMRKWVSADRNVEGSLAQGPGVGESKTVAQLVHPMEHGASWLQNCSFCVLTLRPKMYR